MSSLATADRDAFAAFVDALCAPADRGRRAVLGALGRRGAWLTDRDARVAVYATFTVVVALATTAAAPIAMLALGPVLLGVPHLLADARYLVVRPGLHRRAAVVLAIGLPIALAAITGRSAFGFGACAAAALVARGSLARRATVVALAVAVVALAILRRGAVDLAFAHLHNFVAVALWWAWRPRRTRGQIAALALFVAASLAILGGALPTPSAGLARHLAALAPMVRPELGARLVLLFAFAQSVHYGVWLRLVPEDDRPRQAPRPFASSLRALRAELGAPVLVVFAVLALGLVAWATRDLAAARAGYLRFANLHGHLELACASLLFVSGRAAPRRGRVRIHPCSAGSSPSP